MKSIPQWLKIAGGIVLGLIVLALIGNAAAVWYFGGKYEAKIEALRAGGQPVTLADLKPPTIPPDENLATYIDRANADMESLHNEFFSVEHGTKSGSYTREDIERFAGLRDQYPRVLPLLDQATRCSKLDLELDYSLPASQLIGPMLDKQQRFRAAARILELQALWHQSRGQADEAIDKCVQIMKIGRQVQANATTMISYLVGGAILSVGIDTANQVLSANGNISPMARKTLAAELMAQDPVAMFSNALTKERAFGLASYHEILDHPWIPGGYFYNDATNYLDILAQFIAASEKPYVQVKESIPTHQRQNVRHALSNQMVPAITAMLNARYRFEALTNCLLVVNALDEQATGSEESVTIESLSLPPRSKQDPFTGNPLLLKKTPEEWIVYSVGENLIDDGGDIDQIADIGLRFPAPKVPAQ